MRFEVLIFAAALAVEIETPAGRPFLLYVLPATGPLSKIDWKWVMDFLERGAMMEPMVRLMYSWSESEESMVIFLIFEENFR